MFSSPQSWVKLNFANGSSVTAPMRGTALYQVGVTASYQGTGFSRAVSMQTSIGLQPLRPPRPEFR
jgi:hypothetical protein